MVGIVFDAIGGCCQTVKNSFGHSQIAGDWRWVSDPGHRAVPAPITERFRPVLLRAPASGRAAQRSGAPSVRPTATSEARSDAACGVRWTVGDWWSAGGSGDPVVAVASTAVGLRERLLSDERLLCAETRVCPAPPTTRWRPEGPREVTRLSEGVSAVH